MREPGTTARRIGPLALALALSTLAAPAAHAAVTAQSVGGCQTTTVLRTLQGTPSNYLTLAGSLRPGDRLVLAAGNYTKGLKLWNKSGVAGKCIQIEGPATGSPAVFVGRSGYNTISLQNVAWLAIRNLTLDGRNLSIDAVKAEATSSYAHHVTLENLTIRNHGYGLWTAGINSKCPSWNWVIRRNVIPRAGTAIYLGKPDGSTEFVSSLIENNLVTDSRQYDMQIKHQNKRNTAISEPASGVTVIRDNVWGKAANGATGSNARPNVLLGHWPLSGNGSQDVYLVHDNFFWQNPTEALFQGEGNIAFYDNLLVNDGGRAIAIQKQNDLPRRIDVFHNTVVAKTEGIAIRKASTAYAQRVFGNAVFASTPLVGGQASDNVTDAYGRAWLYLQNPDGVVSGSSNRLDLGPKPAMLYGPAATTAGISGYEGWNLDFADVGTDFTMRGAYATEGPTTSWLPALERQP